jgi:hypothetical protein
MEQTNQNQEPQFRCTGDCINCNRAQREYCGAQKGYDNQRLLLEMQKTLAAMSGTVEELKHKVAAIQDNEAMVFDPSNETAAVIQQQQGMMERRTSETAQEGDGAEE